MKDQSQLMETSSGHYILCSAKKICKARELDEKFVTSQETVTDMGRTGSTAAE